MLLKTNPNQETNTLQLSSHITKEINTFRKKKHTQPLEIWGKVKANTDLIRTVTVHYCIVKKNAQNYSPKYKNKNVELDVIKK